MQNSIQKNWIIRSSKDSSRIVRQIIAQGETCEVNDIVSGKYVAKFDVHNPDSQFVLTKIDLADKLMLKDFNIDFKNTVKESMEIVKIYAEMTFKDATMDYVLE